jgi:hypothetical protein
MHPRQAAIIHQAAELLDRTAAKAPPPPKTVALWKHTDPDGNVFYTESKMTTIKSPFSGKSFTSKPVKHTPSQLGQDIKQEIKDTKKASELDPWKA